MIIDAHVHIFDNICGRIRNLKTEDGGWGTVRCGDDFINVLPPYNPKTTFTAESLIKYMNIEDIEKAVLLQGCFYGNQNKIVKKALIDYPGRLAGAMYLEPWHDNAREYFEKNIKSFDALKMEISEPTGFLGWNTDFKLTDHMWLYKELARRNKTLVLDLGEAGKNAYQTEGVKKIIDIDSNIKIVICHLAQPRSHYFIEEKLMNDWKHQIMLSEYGNVAFDISSLSSYFLNEIYPYDTGMKFFHMAVEIAGTKRILTGTDMPGNSLKATYRQMLHLPEIYGKSIGLSKKEVENIMGSNAERFYFGNSEDI